MLHGGYQIGLRRQFYMSASKAASQRKVFVRWPWELEHLLMEFWPFTCGFGRGFTQPCVCVRACDRACVCVFLLWDAQNVAGARACEKTIQRKPVWKREVCVFLSQRRNRWSPTPVEQNDRTKPRDSSGVESLGPEPKQRYSRDRRTTREGRAVERPVSDSSGEAVGDGPGEGNTLSPEHRR